MITTKSYSISYQKINELSHLGKSLPPRVFNNSKYFKSVKDLFWRITSLEEKYKTLMEKIKDSEMRADYLIGIRDRRGLKALNERLSKGQSGFSSTSYGSNGITVNFGSKKIDTVLQDYITRYSELLETLKYLIADIYNDPLGERDSFNAFIAKNTTRMKNDFDLSYLTDFNKYLWNEQKHHSDISVTPIIYKPDETVMPKLRAEGRFRKVDITIFTEESLGNMINLLRFIHNYCQSNSQNKS
ncbi:hypothetical protein COU94_02965 [Candidatus Shapirobacteria bacterium CG10_big_fil_rev_8_21_14_0_10_38_8]|nr:MAG: hypothetical protein COU94_02965 [Candidatus Shapirobacteria bacterium CG10_big_fil_rev_8_21_14_0_10_38_8]